MKNLLSLYFALIALAFLPSPVIAQELSESSNKISTVKSPKNRVALLELYTSEGCSSCPPADRFLSNLKKSGISSKQLIPIAFHVTYWDYIGWKDRYGKKQYDQRQRDLAHKHNKTTVYTPQFVLVGDDYRQYSTFDKDISKLVSQKSTIDIELSMERVEDKLLLTLKSNIENSDVKDVAFYLAVIENNLSSDVNDGENEGEKLKHDYVVRDLSVVYYHSKSEKLKSKNKIIKLGADWKKNDVSIVAFAENPHTGEVLQAVRLKY